VKLIKLGHDCGLGGNVVNVHNELNNDETKKNIPCSHLSTQSLTGNAFNQVPNPFTIIARFSMIKRLANSKVS
jgi:hypothetical protein